MKKCNISFKKLGKFQEWAITDVLNQIGLHTFAGAKIIDDDEDDSGDSNVTELYLCLFYFFMITLILTGLCVYLFDGMETYILDSFFF